MFARGPLLTVQQGSSGTFVRFLHEIGLEEFLKQYPIAQLIEWGWLVPYRRVVFPAKYFENWQNFPCFGEQSSAEYENYGLLWDAIWDIDDEKEHLWFLHPTFRPGDETEQLLQANAALITLPPIPDEIRHSNGQAIKPYVDYFFHWQAYALIDVIQAADCITPILNTPDVEERAQGIVRVANHVKGFNPTDVLTHERQWGGLAKLMRCISHYRSFRDAMTKIGDESEDRYAMRRKGSRLLAEHLEIEPETLAIAIREDFLRQAQKWRWSLTRRNRLIENAWPFLQTDVGIGMEWLCKLTGKTLEHYLEEWQYTHRAEEGWAELQMVLPYGFFSDRAKFLQMAPIYLGKFPITSHARQLTNDSSLRELVDSIRGKNHSFLNLLGAFRQLHEELSHTPSKKGGLDFRERRPLDSYAVVAFRAETCLRDELERLGEMQNVEKHSLEGYILALSKKIALSEEAQRCFEHRKKLAQLQKTPSDAIDRIQGMETTLENGEHEFVQAFIATCLARNYFAHHRYLDRELLRSDKSAFVLGGILLTVLCLLA